MSIIKHLTVFFCGGGGGRSDFSGEERTSIKMGYQGGVFYNVQYTGPLIQFLKLSKPLRRRECKLAKQTHKIVSISNPC